MKNDGKPTFLKRNRIRFARTDETDSDGSNIVTTNVAVTPR